MPKSSTGSGASGGPDSGPDSAKGASNPASYSDQSFSYLHLTTLSDDPYIAVIVIISK